MSKQVVVVGAGQAGAALVAKLRALGHEGQITLVGTDPLPPYQRPPLSKKYLLGELDAERLLLKPTSFYADNNISTRFGTPVDAIDRGQKQIVMGRDRIDYDCLALTTGARVHRLPSRIGGDLAGVFAIRDVGDVDRLRPEVVVGRRALVVGGGYIGLEAAAVLANKGVVVTLIEMAERILGRVASPETAAFFRALHTRQGVVLHEGVGLQVLRGHEGRVSSAELSDGTDLAVDFVVAGIGITPETTLAERAGLRIDNGIAVDETCRTSDPSIFAAGDCASFPSQGGRLRLESVQNAIDQAEHAAAAMLGSSEPYAPEPWFWSDQYDCKLQIAGLNTGYDQTVTRPGLRAGGQSVWYYRDGTFIAVDAMNDPRAYMQGKRWLAEGITPDPDRIADATEDLKALGIRED